LEVRNNCQKYDGKNESWIDFRENRFVSRKQWKGKRETHYAVSRMKERKKELEEAG
jgi:hypothetical protein